MTKFIAVLVFFQEVNNHRCNRFSQMSIVYSEVFPNRSQSSDVMVPLLKTQKSVTIAGLTPGSIYNLYLVVQNDDNLETRSQTAQVMLTQG